MDKLIHTILTARLPEDALVAHKTLHVSDDLQQNNLTTAGYGHAKCQLMVSTDWRGIRNWICVCVCVCVCACVCV